MEKITIALDEVREIKFSINAMVELEDRFDKSVPELFSGLPGVKTMVAILRIGLKFGGMKVPGKTIEDQEVFVGDLIQQHWIDQGGDMKDLMDNYVKSALQIAGLIPKDEEEEEEVNPNSGTGE